MWQCYECALSQVGTHPDMTLDVARILSSKEKPLKKQLDNRSVDKCRGGDYVIAEGILGILQKENSFEMRFLSSITCLSYIFIV